MPKIINQDLASIYNGYAADQAKYWNQPYLIQIFDINCTRDFPTSFKGLVKEKDAFTFEFLDIEDPKDFFDCPDVFESACIQDYQAAIINQILHKAYDEGRDVVVHCTAGVCRSGAVVQYAVDIGFDDPEIYRAPNLLVLKKLRVANNTYKDEGYFKDVYGCDTLE